MTLSGLSDVCKDSGRHSSFGSCLHDCGGSRRQSNSADTNLQLCERDACSRSRDGWNNLWAVFLGESFDGVTATYNLYISVASDINDPFRVGSAALFPLRLGLRNTGAYTLSVIDGSEYHV